MPTVADVSTSAPTSFRSPLSFPVMYHPALPLIMLRLTALPTVPVSLNCRMRPVFMVFCLVGNLSSGLGNACLKGGSDCGQPDLAGIYQRFG